MKAKEKQFHDDLFQKAVNSVFRRKAVKEHVIRSHLDSLTIEDKTRGLFTTYDNGRTKIVVPYYGTGYVKKNPRIYEYYLIHELAHFAQFLNGDVIGHNRSFYKYFFDMCPKELLPYEYEYMKSSLKWHRILEREGKL